MKEEADLDIKEGLKSKLEQLQNVSNSEKVDILNQLAVAYLAQSPVTALEYFKEALQLAREIDNRQGESLALRGIGTVHFQLGDYVEAFPNYQESLKLEKEMNNVSGIAGLLNNIAMLHGQTGATEKALETNLEAMKLLEGVENRDNVRRVILINTGNCYLQLEDYDKSLEFYEKSLSICQKMADQEGIAYSFCDSAFVYQKQKKYAEAEKYYQKALDIRRKLKSNYVLSSTLLKMGNCIMENGEIERGKKYLEEGLLIAEAGNFKELEKDGLQYISSALEQEGRYKEALEFHKRFADKRHLLYNEDNSRILANMQSRFDLKQKAQDIANLTENKKLLEEKIKERTEELEQEIRKHKQTEEELKKHRDNLEKIVKDRTHKLEEQKADLENMNKVFVGREFRIKELRDEVKALKMKYER